jgi:DNA-binding NtrC family response regulator
MAHPTPPQTDDAAVPTEPALEDGELELLITAPGQAEVRRRFAGAELSIGSHPSNELVLADPAVSRFHCELVPEGDVLLVRDLGSRNGTQVDGVRVREAFLGRGSLLQVGRTLLRAGRPPSPKPSAPTRESFGGLVGESAAMRQAFTLLDRAARSLATVLLEGETGTGKGEAAQALHQEGPRRERPFVVLDCGAIPANLVESELFGHERGAFTGADQQRLGVFEAAHQGTLFLDEIGELPLEVQPKLLRALEEKSIRRVGSTRQIPVDVRVIAATHRDLRSAVNEGSFRADLFYRLAVVRVRLPALRDRLADLPGIVASLLDGLGATPEQRERLGSREQLSSLRRASWPGNVRELRNTLERSLVLDLDEPLIDAAPASPSGGFQETRARVLATFERDYLERLLRDHQGNVAAAAQAAQLSRVYLYRLLQRHRLLR